MGMGGLFGLKAVGDAADAGEIPQGVWITYSLLSSATAVAGAYHGYKRNNSAGWALVWFLLSGSFFMFAAPLMLAQGFAKPARKG